MVRKDRYFAKVKFVCQKRSKANFLNPIDNIASLMRKTNLLLTQKKYVNCELNWPSAVNEFTTQSRKLLSSKPFQQYEYAMLKKEDTVTSLSHIVEPWVENNFDEKFRMEARVERSLIAKASIVLFHSSSQMSLTSYFQKF